MKDIEIACKGAVLKYEMEIQFDSTGGSEMVTPEKNIETWITQVKEANQE